jgi:hypothetical protein
MRRGRKRGGPPAAGVRPLRGRHDLLCRRLQPRAHERPTPHRESACGSANRQPSSRTPAIRACETMTCQQAESAGRCFAADRAGTPADDEAPDALALEALALSVLVRWLPRCRLRLYRDGTAQQGNNTTTAMGSHSGHQRHRRVQGRAWVYEPVCSRPLA